MKRAATIAILLFAVPAHADETDDLFRDANAALAAGKPGEAIASFEALGDRGVVDPVVSYDRGLAYAARVRAGSEQLGDLGRAAHGFEEARELTKDRALARAAENALAIVRSEVARRRSRSGDPVEIEHGFSLGRAIVELLPENAWATLAGIVAIALSIAIVARRIFTTGRARVAATTAGAIAGGLLAVTALLAWAARDARLHLREGVIVVPNARLLDAKHIAIEGKAALPEGARVQVHVESENGGFTRIELGHAEGFVPTSAVLLLSKR
jgi:hypothetical protein